MVWGSSNDTKTICIWKHCYNLAIPKSSSSAQFQLLILCSASLTKLMVALNTNGLRNKIRRAKPKGSWNPKRPSSGPDKTTNDLKTQSLLQCSGSHSPFVSGNSNHPSFTLLSLTFLSQVNPVSPVTHSPSTITYTLQLLNTMSRWAKLEDLDFWCLQDTHKQREQSAY